MTVRAPLPSLVAWIILGGGGQMAAANLVARPPTNDNQVGYLPASDSKHGYVSHWMGDLGGPALDDYSRRAFPASVQKRART
ncbi:MAG: hypothetical protein EHM18_04115 [Acidobacteria bacterium]|nr:MAG: hypothetical protein EHM18_04115 [Acidobacteriota bacterium]